MVGIDVHLSRNLQVVVCCSGLEPFHTWAGSWFDVAYCSAHFVFSLRACGCVLMLFTCVVTALGWVCAPPLASVVGVGVLRLWRVTLWAWVVGFEGMAAGSLVAPFVTIRLLFRAACLFDISCIVGLFWA